MSAADVPLIIVLAVLFLMAVVLAASEAALLRVPRFRVVVQAENGVRGAKRLLRLVDDLPRVMNTVLLVVLLVQIGAATVTGILAERHFGSLGITISSIVLTLVLFVYAEAIPKTYAVRHPMLVARLVSTPIRWLTTLLRPVITVLVAFADLQAPGTGIAGAGSVTEDELRRLAAEAASEGSIEPADVELIERAFEFGDIRVDAIQVPRTLVVAVGADRSVREALEIAIGSGHRRLPVYREDLDDISGVVWLRDLARAVAAGESGPVGLLARRVLVVPESKKVIELLEEMQNSALRFAVVVDEHGGTSGIVTIEDVLSELVGEVAEQEAPRVPLVRDLGDGRWLVDAAAPVGELTSLIGRRVPEGDWHTVGGWVTSLFGRIPEVGDTVEHDGVSYRVTAAGPRRVGRVEVVMIDDEVDA